MIFRTDQREGRLCDAYTSIESLDLCKECDELILNGLAINAYYAQGHNTYKFNKYGDYGTDAAGLAKLQKENK